MIWPWPPMSWPPHVGWQMSGCPTSPPPQAFRHGRSTTTSTARRPPSLGLGDKTCRSDGRQPPRPSRRRTALRRARGGYYRPVRRGRGGWAAAGVATVGFAAVVASEPSLHGEYLKASNAGLSAAAVRGPRSTHSRECQRTANTRPRRHGCRCRACRRHVLDAARSAGIPGRNGSGSRTTGRSRIEHLQ